MSPETAIGLGWVAVFFAAVFKIVVVLIFFMLMNRLVKAVERIEQHFVRSGKAAGEISN